MAKHPHPSVAVQLGGVRPEVGAYGAIVDDAAEMPRQRDKLYATLVHAIGGIVWEADPDSFQFSFVSAQAERILGYPVRAWLEPGFWQRHTHPDDVDRCAMFCMDATRAGRDHAFEYRMIAADGRVVWLRDIVSVRVSEEGSKRLVGVALDITAQKQEEADKARMSRIYEALLENSSDNIAVIRRDASR